MQFFTRQQMGALTTSYLISSASCLIIVQPNGQMLQTQNIPSTPMLHWWMEENYAGPRWETAQSEPIGRQGKGDCVNMRDAENTALSAKAPNGWKCTLYDQNGCHGARTREFNSDGIPSMGWMSGRASAWRCCEIGKTNYWGMCEAKLNPGS